MNIAHLTRAIFPQHGYGGLERASTGLTRALLQMGVDVTLFTRPLPPGKPFAQPSGSGRLSVRAVRYGRLPLRPNGIPARLTNYRAFVEEMGKQVEQMARKGMVRGIYANGLCAWGVRRADEWGVPMVANPHGMEDFKVRDPLKRLAYAPFRAWTRAGCRAADRVIATDASMKDEVARLLGVDTRKVVTIPNAIDIQEVRSYASTRVQAELATRWPHLAAPPDTLKGISVGRLEANKGFDVLLRALSQLQNSGQLAAGWGWLIVGSGTRGAHLRSLASELGVADRVLFVGSLNETELHNLYEMCNLFVHPALYEGSSLVTLEAASHGLPIVASAVGGIPDKVVPGRTGLLVPPGSAGSLARAVAAIWSDTGAAARMGHEGARLVEQGFTWDRAAEQTARLFEELLVEKMGCSDARLGTGTPS